MKQKLLILGVSGMIGHTIFKHFSEKNIFNTFGTVRSKNNLNKYFNLDELNNITDGIDIENFDTILNLCATIKPNIIINCIGITKHLPESSSHLKSITINALLPHKLANLCLLLNARLIHISTDCVFDGQKGNYLETDNSDAQDLYGKSKYLGEVHCHHVMTIRTSTIGHELSSYFGLVDWFLNQHNTANGYTNALYNGVSTYELAKIIEEYIIPNTNLWGLYHVSANPISKYDLLDMVAKVYNKSITLKKFDDFVINRTLNSQKFQNVVNYKAKSWEEMINDMYNKLILSYYYQDKRNKLHLL